MLEEIFDEPTLKILYSRPVRLKSEQFRLQVLNASGPISKDYREPHRLFAFRASRAAWDVYVSAAKVVGLLDGVNGAKLKSDLRSPDPFVFEAAMAECMTAWYFAGRLKKECKPYPCGRDNRILDLEVIDSPNFNVEVKRPRRPLWSDEIDNDDPPTISYSGDDSDVLEKSLNDASKQFSDDSPNVLCLVPHLRHSISGDRRQFTKAFIGEAVLKISVATEDISADIEPEIGFKQSGKLLRWDSSRNKYLYQRVSAVVVIEEYIDPQSWDHMPIRPELFFVNHRVFVVHNPFAYKPISPSVFGDAIQLVNDGSSLWWTDGKPVG